MPGTCGTSRSSSTPGGVRDAVPRRATWSSPGKLTAARAGSLWLAEGSQTVQQQALRDFARAMAGFFARTHGLPSWRKAGKDEGFRITGQRGRHWDVRRLSRNKGEVRVPKAANMTRSAKGTAEQPGRNVRAKAGLNREISRSGWGPLVRRLEDQAPGRVERVPPAYTSQRCSACGRVDGRSRESQARFRCTACGYAGNADVNAARNIAAGHAVKARGGDGASRPVNREPQLLASQRG
jgi:transposase